MDIMKSLTAAMLPIALIVVLQVIAPLVGLVPIIAMLTWCTCVILIPAHAWVGYAIRKSGLSMEDSAAVGAVAGLVSGIANVIMSFVAIFLSGIMGVTLGGNDVGTSALVGVVGAGFTGVAALCSIPIYAVIGAILAVVGYFIADQMK